MRCMASAGALCALLTSTLALSPAQAENNVGEVPTVSVKISDLNLASPSGQAMMRRRINHAIVHLCDSGDRADMVRENTCRANAAASARTAMDNAIERAKAGKVDSAVTLRAR